MKNRIEELRRARRLSMDALAMAVGTSAPTINKLEKGRMRLSDRWIGPIAEALGVSPAELLSAPSIAEDTARRDLPVYGLAAGAFNGAAQISSDPVEWVPAPPALARVREAYALIVSGSSMEPRYAAGDVIFINPNRPPRPGDHVVIQVQAHDGATVETWLKQLMRVDETQVHARQYNPPATMSFRRAAVRRLHRVMTVNELLGI